MRMRPGPSGARQPTSGANSASRGGLANSWVRLCPPGAAIGRRTRRLGQRQARPSKAGSCRQHLSQRADLAGPAWSWSRQLWIGSGHCKPLAWPSDWLVYARMPRPMTGASGFRPVANVRFRPIVDLSGSCVPRRHNRRWPSLRRCPVQQLAEPEALNRDIVEDVVKLPIVLNTRFSPEIARQYGPRLLREIITRQSMSWAK